MCVFFHLFSVFFCSIRPCCWIQCSDAFIYCRLARFTGTSVIVKPDVAAGRRPLFLWVLSPVFLRLSKPSLLRSTFYRNIFFFSFSTFFITKTVALSCICLLHQLRCKTTNLLFLIFLFFFVLSCNPPAKCVFAVCFIWFFFSLSVAGGYTIELALGRTAAIILLYSSIY